MKKFPLVFAFGVILVLWAPTVVATSAYDEQWLALGHYQKKIFSGYTSSIDSESFFIAEDGKNNPDSELTATIKLFDEGKDKKKICLFPARYKYLTNKGLEFKHKVRCEEYEQFKTDLKPSGVTLLFTDAYMNNPSSLFGHTLLRIDTARKGTQLLAHGANYGAFTNENENGALFAIYGLTGGYYGGWTIKPYYDIINTYNNIENRDIWELNLSFSEDELDTMVAHLWELGHTQTRYYFFTKNCSYMIMEMLDAVRPNLNLAKQFPLQVIPLDTAKAVHRHPQLVKEINYRPSRLAKIVQRKKNMNDEQKKALLTVVKDKDYSLSMLKESDKADVLEAAYQYVQYQYIKKDLALEEYRNRSFLGLSARNRIKNPEVNFEENPQGKSPLQAHESMRVTLGTGHYNGESFQEFSYRPAYHSLTDNNYGLLPGAEINFLNFKLRHYDQSKKTVLNELNILGIRSLSPMDSLFTPVSFAMNVDIKREINPENNKQGYVFNGRVGGGATFETLDNVYMYVLGSSYLSYGGFLPHNQYVGMGAATGVFADFTYFKLLAEAEKIWATTWFGSKIKYSSEINIPLSTNWGLAFEYHFDDNQKGRDSEEYMTSVRHYF